MCIVVILCFYVPPSDSFAPLRIIMFFVKEMRRKSELCASKLLSLYQKCLKTNLSTEELVAYLYLYLVICV